MYLYCIHEVVSGHWQRYPVVKQITMTTSLLIISFKRWNI